jgi:hypothetical protein
MKETCFGWKYEGDAAPCAIKVKLGDRGRVTVVSRLWSYHRYHERERRTRMLTEDRRALAELEERIRSCEKSPEEVARLLSRVTPFDYAQWVRENPPATAEELAEMEAMVRERRADREASLAREAGLGTP